MAEATNNQAIDEDDYMGDLFQFVPPDITDPPKSSKKDSTSKTQIPQSTNKKPKTLNWQEQRKLKREQKQEEEDKQTLVNLESAIPQSNIGFKLLKQMGYTPGSALGKEGSGRAEPVSVEIRRGRAGIGRDDPRKEKRREEEIMETEKRKEDELIKDFGWRQKEQWRSRRVVVNYHKAKAALEQLENKEEVVDEAEAKDEENGENEEEEEEVITEEDLQAIVMKLREEHQYCLFCGCRYESVEVLLSNCPGTDEDDH